MTFMAVYNIDPFKDFVFNSSFLRRYRVKTALIKEMETDDVKLLRFGFEWVKFLLWGHKARCSEPR